MIMALLIILVIAIPVLIYAIYHSNGFLGDVLHIIVFILRVLVVLGAIVLGIGVPFIFIFGHGLL